ncbi:uncharacterized protein LOC119689456 [Teleopsis dalmanni]|uniref:uncharacterized protein LOC119689456 n=2 Tax=Teleopsis dalmanni TaxID=139649 RepID=UPI0018CC8008|nr:uncharacterized protein LOC119689456 [Teleopsis dalmanni]
MLKHVQISPLRNRSDSISLRSTTSCASSMCGSPEPPADLQRTPSRASSYSSLNEQLPQTTIKIFTNCLKIDIEYKTLGIQWDTTSKEVITQLLRRLKMRHRDPRLFYLTMEVLVRRANVKNTLVLDEDTRPAILQACHPKGESRFCLQLKPGGLIRVHTSALQPTSQYKSLVISEETTSDELLQLLLSCYNSMEPVEQFSIYEVCPGQEYQRKLHPDDIPLRAQVERMKRGESCHFLVRRNPNYARRRQLLPTLNDVVQNYSTSSTSNKSFDANSTLSSLDDTNSLLDMSIESLSDDLHSLTASDEDEDCASSTSGSSDTSSEGSTTVRRIPSHLSIVPVNAATNILHDKCMKCRNNYKSCEFCHKNSAVMQWQRQAKATATATAASKQLLQMRLPTYNPVYNIREIRTVSHSFSSLGNDKKLLDIQLNGCFDAATATMPMPAKVATSSSPTTTRIRPQSVYMGRTTQQAMIMDDVNKNVNMSDVNGNNNPNTITKCLAKATGLALMTTVAGEAVNNNPAKGLGHFVYL